MADYTNTRGIFSLLDVRERQAAGVWSTREDVWNAPSPFNASTPAPFGYFAGGNTPSPENESSGIDRVDYSNDTATALARGSLNTGRRNLSATGNASFCYFGGGYNATPGGLTTVDRIDYGNDTATALAKGPLSLPSYSLAATGNINFGYFAGGRRAGSPPETSRVDRIDYSNDTATASPKGPLSAVRGYGVQATGNQSFGYVGGGGQPGKSTVERIDYGNDTATASPKGPLSSARNYLAATGNASFGYFGGGGSPSK